MNPDKNPEKQLALIIPVYNEQDLIGLVLDDWIQELRLLKIDFEIHIYDDGSSDETSYVIKTMSRKNKEIIGHYNANKGHGPTILQGFHENLHFDWIFQVDSDNEIAASFFKNLWTTRNNYDLLIGKRGGRIQNPARYVMSLVSRFVVHFCYHSKKVWDVNSPFRLMRSKPLESIISMIPSNTFAPNLIISGMASLKRLRIFEIDVEHTASKKSSLKFRKLLFISLLSFFQTIKFRMTYEKGKRSGKV